MAVPGRAHPFRAKENAPPLVILITKRLTGSATRSVVNASTYLLPMLATEKETILSL